MSVSMSTTAAADKTDAFVNRVLQSCLGMLDIVTMYVGERLGLYQSLATAGPATSNELARRTGFVERYVREWLEQQTVTGILQVDRPDADAGARRYALPASHAEVLLDADSLNFLGPYPRQMVGSARPLEALLLAFRNGGGIPYGAHGAGCPAGVAAGDPGQFLNPPGTTWVSSDSQLAQRLP